MILKKNLPRLSNVLATLLFSTTSIIATAQTYPTKPITVVVPYGPGTGNDIIARIIAQKVSETSGQPMVIDNRAGANGNIGADYVARAQPDGYTVLIASTSSVVNQFVTKDSRLDIAKDFTPVGLIGSLRNVLMANQALPANSMKELIASGRVELLWTTTASALSLVDTGKVKLLGVTGPKRSTVVPTIPTMIESGYPELDISIDFFFLAPAGTPAAVVAKLNREIVTALNTKEVKEKLASAGVEANGGSPEALAQYIQADMARWARLVKETHYKVQ